MSITAQMLFVLLADVSGSAARDEKLAEAEVVQAVDQCLQRMTRAADAEQGRTVQIAGDELLAVFASADQACRAAIAMQQSIADLPPVAGLKLAIRIGLHAGEFTEAAKQLSGPALTTAARITGLASSQQILCSAHLRDALPANLRHSALPLAGSAGVVESGADQAIYQIEWLPTPTPHSPPLARVPEVKPSRAPAMGRLCVRHQGKAYLLDDKTPILTMGRDPACMLLIADRKVSRQHARIERRGQAFYLVDTSTNGSFVTQAGQQEIMLRRHEVRLEQSGRISFGSSGNDPHVEFAEFEYLP